MTHLGETQEGSLGTSLSKLWETMTQMTWELPLQLWVPLLEL